MVTRSPPPGVNIVGNKAPGCNIRCDNCKVVINELLAFISQKIDTLKEDSIIKICVSSYSMEEIENARSTAYTLMCPAKRITRRKEGQEEKSIQEIVKLIKEYQPDALPIFVARNLNKLPAVSFDHIDITAFLKDMTLLKSEVASLKNKSENKSDNTALSLDIESVKSEISSVKRMISDMQDTCLKQLPTYDSISSLRSYHNDKNTGNDQLNVLTTENVGSDTCLTAAARAAYLTHGGGRGGSGPLTAPAPRSQTSSARPTSTHSHVPTNTTSYASAILTKTSTLPRTGTEQLTTDNTTVNIPSYSDITVTLQDSANQLTDNEGFTAVTRKKYPYRYRNTRGTLQSSSKLQAAETYGYIYISRIKKQTTESDIMDYIKEMQEECQAIELLKQSKETNFNSFKITVCTSKLSKFLQNDFWPENVVFRRYRQPRSSRGDNVFNNKLL